ncbi:MAG: hypothetical protein ABIP55_04310 [Tepidisphaeraceae bacterium]
MDVAFTIVVFFVVIVITALIFFGWIAFTVIRLAISGIAALFRPACIRAPGGMGGQRLRQVPVAAQQMVRCATHGCHMMNPAAARFCRRCGRGLPGSQRVDVRRAAVW